MAATQPATGPASASLADGSRWIPTACGMCYAQCSIVARVQDGVVRKIEGNPKSPVGAGKLCPKGVSGIMTLYDPHRLNVPMMRTNPEKGIGVDPGWREISWEMATELIVEKLRRIRAENPSQLLLTRTTTIGTTRNALPWMTAFGSSNIWAAGGSLHCGNGAHLFGGMFHASWSLHPDFAHCKYAIYFGASKGHSAGHSATSIARLAADARAGGMQLVVVDPLHGAAGGKSTQWVPIRVGTDAALALGMLHVMLNELGVWDTTYLRHRTNGAYLIQPDGHYLRDPDTGKPLVWDEAAGRARRFDDPELGTAALLGSYTVQGVPCQPGFQLIKDHVKQYPPERVAEITTVPAATVRQLAHDFATNAQIGATIEVEGHRLPFRPVAAIYFRGAQGHKNSVWTCLAIELLNQIVGAADVPGGALGFNPARQGVPGTGRFAYEPFAGPDGLMVAGLWPKAHKPFPPSDPKVHNLTLSDAWPLTNVSGSLYSRDNEEIWTALGVPYRPEMLINIGSNPVLTVGNPATAAAALCKIPFMVSFDLFLTEFSELCDVVLPDTSSYERLEPAPQWPPLHDHPGGLGDWAWPIRQPIIAPVGQRRDFQEVFLEWAHRAGFAADYHMVINRVWSIQGPWALVPDQPYSWAEICDRFLKSTFGAEHDLAWFQEHGLMRWPKTAREVYWRPFVSARVPLYPEMIQTVGEKQQALLAGTDLGQRLDWSRWGPLPEWRPCPSHLETRPEFDLWAFYYRDVLHTNAFTYENPWLNEVSEANPFTYNIAINAAAAARKGLASGDWVVLESSAGRQVRGRIIATELIHPDHVAVAGCGGHYTNHQPIAKGKGVLFNELLEIDLDHMDPVNLNLDLCVKVRIHKDRQEGV